jgi:phosphoribosylamine--glycine ligase
MKVLVLGGGGREHAIVWKLLQSKRVTEVVCAPGNGGIAGEARCIPVDLNDLAATVALVQVEAPDLTVVGPELPLSLGLVDALQELDLRVFGPTRAAARLESSKAFAKAFMRSAGIPTAPYVVCATIEEVLQKLPQFSVPFVVKADGLAAGKGVVICQTNDEAIAAAEQMFSGALLGEPVKEIVLEAFITGPELSFFALCDGTHAVPLAAAQDHKRIGEGDTGPNTGGMGAYSTDALLPSPLREWLTENVAQRVVDHMAAAGTPFTGILFCGIMLPHEARSLLTFDGVPVEPIVLEFNTRFGDPETQAIMMRLENDLLDLFEAAVDGRADHLRIELKPGAAACVIAASSGYPGKYPAGKPISGLPKETPVRKVFHSGTALGPDGVIVTAGGRVLAATATAPSGLKDALGLAYAALDEISFEGMQFRRDIGWRAL